MGIIRILLIADTHLGFDLPFRPRIQRRRRGLEFFANFKRALRPALNDEVDAVVHVAGLTDFDPDPRQDSPAEAPGGLAGRLAQLIGGRTRMMKSPSRTLVKITRPSPKNG